MKEYCKNQDIQITIQALCFLNTDINLSCPDVKQSLTIKNQHHILGENMTLIISNFRNVVIKESKLNIMNILIRSADSIVFQDVTITNDVFIYEEERNRIYKKKEQPFPTSLILQSPTVILDKVVFDELSNFNGINLITIEAIKIIITDSKSEGHLVKSKALFFLKAFEIEVSSLTIKNGRSSHSTIMALNVDIDFATITDFTLTNCTLISSKFMYI